MLHFTSFFLNSKSNVSKKSPLLVECSFSRSNPTFNFTSTRAYKLNKNVLNTLKIFRNNPPSLKKNNKHHS